MFTNLMRVRCSIRSPHVVAARTIAGLTLGMCCASAVHADITFVDSTFSDAEWAEEVLANESNAWTTTVGQQLSGGNPDAFRGHNWVTSGTAVENTLVTFNAYSGFSYNPSVAGALASMTFAYDAFVRRPDNTAGVIFVNPALKQGDSVYAVNFSFLASTTSWTHVDRSTLTPGLFAKLSGSGPANPDFGATGAPLTFGYNQWLRAANYEVAHGVDNFSVTLSPVFTGGTTTGHFAVNVDLGDRLAFSGQGALPTAGNTWNVVNGGVTPVNSLKNSENVATSVGYRWTPYTQFDTLQPLNAVGDYLEGDRPALNSDGALNGIGDDPTPGKFGGEMFVTGLLPNSKHELVLYGTLYGEVGDRVNTTTFTVNGKPLSTTSLTDGEGLNYVVFHNVPADANGEIFVRMRNASENVDGRGNGGYWTINGFQVESLGLSNPTYNSNASGDFATAGNWTGGVPTGAGAIAEFKGGDGANISVTLSAPQTLGTIGFGGTRQYTITGSTLTLDGGNGYRGAVNVASGSHTIAAPLAFGSDGGEIILAQDALLKLSSEVSGTVKRLSIGTGATLDLATGSPLIVDYDRFSNFDVINAAVISGREAGGTGITSSNVAANSSLATIVVESSALLGPTGGTFRGQAVDETALLLGVFLKGDSDLSGNVAFDDLLKLAQNYGTLTNQTWLTGDFDFDGAVDFSDLLSLAQNYNGSFAASSTELAAMGLGADFQGDWAMAHSLLPEPTSLLVLAATALGGGRRRR